MQPKKKFGQHFLTSQSAVAKIIELAEVKEGDRIVEIGPGQGALTRKLLDAGAEVTAIEFDPDMVEYISEHYPSVTVIHQDASKVNWETRLNKEYRWKCVSNLPYNVGTKIVKNLLLQGTMFDSLTLMLQKEVGQRMLAGPDEKQRGSLSSFIQAHAETKKGFIVPPGAFFPPPKIDSIVIQLIPRNKPLYFPSSIESFERINRSLFSRPRKTIRNSLRSGLTSEEMSLLQEKADISFALRAANLSNQQIVDLVTIIENFPK